MSKIDLKYEWRKDKDERPFISLNKEDFEKFDLTILGLDDISEDGTYIQALIAIFDLEGFTSFFNQPDPHIVIPEYLSRFISWLFKEISNEIKYDEENGIILLWGELPFYAKFMGDGIIFIWKTNSIPEIGNIIIALDMICQKYINNFLPNIRTHFVKPPLRLRCGISRGQIISIGNGEDYVGPCINISSRLQKIHSLTFAFSRRGIDINDAMSQERQKDYILKKINIRGIGDEIIYVGKKEFELLSPEEQSLFEEP
jgi:hypothetical protein